MTWTPLNYYGQPIEEASFLVGRPGVWQKCSYIAVHPSWVIHGVHFSWALLCQVYSHYRFESGPVSDIVEP
jgi:hypothetical protein